MKQLNKYDHYQEMEEERLLKQVKMKDEKGHTKNNLHEWNSFYGGEKREVRKRIGKIYKTWDRK